MERSMESGRMGGRGIEVDGSWGECGGRESVVEREGQREENGRGIEEMIRGGLRWRLKLEEELVKCRIIRDGRGERREWR